MEKRRGGANLVRAGRRSLLLHRGKADSRRLADLYDLPAAHQAGLSLDEARRGRLMATRKRGITRYQITEFHLRPSRPEA